MHALSVALVASIACACALSLTACAKKASPVQCDALVSKFAELIVREKSPDASADEVIREQGREREEARGDDAFRNCPAEVQETEYRCAMAAPSAETFLKCLE